MNTQELLNIKVTDLPLIVFSDHSSGFIAWLIKWKTKGNYSHVMTMIRPSEVASQGNVFSSVYISRYMTRNSRLKFWKIKGLTLDEKIEIEKRITIRLSLPWWKRMYDFAGIAGQAIGLKFINNPWKVYCSEQVKADCLNVIVEWDQEHPSPKDLNEFMKTNERFEVYCRWSAD